MSSPSALSPKQTVIAGVTELFINRDVTALDRYWSSQYIQHSFLAAPGLEGLHAFASNLPTGFEFEMVRVFSEGDLVVTHGIYRGLGDDALVAFDLFRVADGRIVEHWDALTPVVTETASGHSQTDGPTTVRSPEVTAASKELVEQFVQDILIDGDMSRLAGYYDGDAYVQHNPTIPDLVSGLGGALAALAEAGITMEYKRRHRTLAEGEFVFTQSEGTFGGAPYVFYDLFRVANGFIAEHWDVMVQQPTTLPHDNGLF